MLPCPRDLNIFPLRRTLCVLGKVPSQVLGRQTCWKWVKDAHARTHTPHTLGGDYVLPSARLEHSVVWLIRPGTLMDEYIQPANKFTQLQFGTGLMCLHAQRRTRSKCLRTKPSPSFLLCLKTFFLSGLFFSLSMDS